MLRIILADDEKPIREGLLEYIEWKRYGVEVIGCACDGQDALDQIAEKKPDLVFRALCSLTICVETRNKTRQILKNLNSMLDSAGAEPA